MGAGNRVELTIALTGGTGTYSETVTVTADPFRRTESASPAQQSLDSADIQNLRGVLADDPLRAVQSLSGAATGDDLRSEFSIRGTDFSPSRPSPSTASRRRSSSTRSAPSRITPNSGSVAMINSDVLEGLSSRTEDIRSGPAIALGRPSPSACAKARRDRTEVRGAVSGTSMSAVGEGPVGRSHRGSWLVSARSSYLDRLIDRLSDDGFTFGFSDVQGKLVFDVTPRQQVDVAVIAGRSRLAQPLDNVESDDLFAGRNSSSLAIAGWRLTGHRGLLSAGVLGSTNTFRNDTLQEVVLDRGTDGQVTTRIDGQYQVSRTVQVEAGGVVDWANEARVRERFVNGTLSVVNDYSGDSTRTGGFTLVRWRPIRNVQLVPGLRVDSWTVVRSTKASPWLQAEWQVAGSVTVRGGAGVYRQAPELEQVIGAWSAPNPDLERSSQVPSRCRMAAARVDSCAGHGVRPPGCGLHAPCRGRDTACRDAARAWEPNGTIRQSVGRLRARRRDPDAAPESERAHRLGVVRVRPQPVS